MRRQRTIYYNDARHYYLFVFEPPMTLEDARRPVDEVAGTAVDTFIYGVARNDGMFYDTKVGKRFGVDARPFVQNNHWRTWANMQSLIDRGLDPLDVLIDRAHDKGMEFFASLRMSSYGATYPELSVAQADAAWPKNRLGRMSSPCWRSWPHNTMWRGWSWTSPPHRAGWTTGSGPGTWRSTRLQ